MKQKVSTAVWCYNAGMFTTLLTIGVILLLVGIVGKFLGLAIKFVVALIVIGLLVGLASLLF